MANTRTPGTSEVSLGQMFFIHLLQLPEGDRFRTCLQCGTCAGVCPYGEWMDYTPRKLISYLQSDLFEQALNSPTIWMCVSCYACTINCPQQIPLTAGLMTSVKERLLLSGKVPAELQTALENTHRYGNPLGESPAARTKWAADIKPPVPILRQINRPVEVLWFVGDYASYHPRLRSATQAFAKILHLLGVDFAILGPEESSDGDSQRLAGESGLFEWLAEKNGKVLQRYQFKEIVTTDPHAFNAFKNEYPRRGISYPVKHYTQFLAERLDDLIPHLKGEVEALVAFHDPCFLGRVNGVYDEPRKLLEAIPGLRLIEMSHNRSASLCCGGGGGGMWLDGYLWEIAKTRLPNWRVQEAIAARPVEDFMFAVEEITRCRRGDRSPLEQKAETKPRILAVACPYEKPRFEDAAKTVETAKDLQVKDIAELLIESIKASEVQPC